jgi:DNA-binding Lrp family transcriptional regulator
MINKKDLLLLSYLRQDGRMTLTKMSRKTHIPISTIFDKLRAHQGGLIRRLSAILDFPKLGFHTKAYVMMKIHKKDKEGVRSYLLNNQHVNTLYKINNGYDFLAECIFKSINQLEYFLDVLEDKFSIKSKNVYYVIDDLKQESFLSDPNMIDMVTAE